MKYLKLLSCLLASLFVSEVFAQTIVTVGTGTSSNINLPFGNYYQYSTTETIYTSGELGGACTITDIAYNVASTSSLSATVKIFMGYKSGSTFSSGTDYVSPSELTLVYSGTRTLGSSTGWENYTLSTPFQYNGTSNLVVVVTKSASSYTNSLKYRYTTSTSKCLYRQNDDNSMYATITNTDAFSLSNEKPNTRFTVNRPTEFYSGNIGAHRFGEYTLGSDRNSVSYAFTTTPGSKFTLSTSKPGGKIYLDGKDTHYVTGRNEDYGLSQIGNTYQVKFTDGLTHVVEVTAPTGTNIAIRDVMVKHPTTILSSTIKTITLEEPGDLKYYISDEDKYYIKKLTISGPIDEADMYLIRQMAGAEFYQSSGSIMGELESLNMQNTTFEPTGKAVALCSGTYQGSYGDYFAHYAIYMTKDVIDECQFCGLTNLREFTIPSSVTSIRNGAFKECHNLTLTFPSDMSLQSIGDEVRGYEYSGSTFNMAVKRVNICNLAKWCGITFHNPEDNPIYSTGSFYDSKSASSPVTSLVVPSEVTRIGDYAFYNCTSLNTLTLPFGLSYIGSSAFYKCTSLSSITANGGLGYVGRLAFGECTAISSVNTHDLKAWCESRFSPSDISVPVYDSEGYKAYAYDSEDGSYLIHAQDYVYQSNPVYYSKSLKYNGTTITSLVIPEGTAKIGEGAFANCTGITSVTIPSSVTQVGAMAFQGCSSLAKVNIEDVGAWASIVFQSKIIPYYNCTLYNYDPEDGTYSYYLSAGYVYTSNPLTITKNLYCNGEKVVTAAITNGTTELGYYAFLDYTPLESVTIPRSVTNIGDGMFQGCINLASIHSISSSPAICTNSSVFSNINPTTILYVPALSVSAYQNADYWKNFNIIGVQNGDVNLDQKVNVTDAVEIVNNVVGEASERFVKCWSDVNSDDQYTIADAMAVVNIILGEEIGASYAMNHAPMAENDHLSLYSTDSNNMTLAMENMMQYSSFQFDVNLPEGMSLENVTLNQNRCQDFSVMFRETGENKFTVAVFNLGNEPFATGSGSLVDMSLSGSGNLGDAMISNIHFSTTRAVDVQFEDMMLSDVTGVESVDINVNNQNAPVYDLSGRRLNGTQRGVNIINGKKIIK